MRTDEQAAACLTVVFDHFIDALRALSLPTGELSGDDMDLAAGRHAHMLASGIWLTGWC